MPEATILSTYLILSIRTILSGTQYTLSLRILNPQHSNTMPATRINVKGKGLNQDSLSKCIRNYSLSCYKPAMSHTIVPAQSSRVTRISKLLENYIFGPRTKRSNTVSLTVLLNNVDCASILFLSAEGAGPRLYELVFIACSCPRKGGEERCEPPTQNVETLSARLRRWRELIRV